MKYKIVPIEREHGMKVFDKDFYKPDIDRSKEWLETIINNSIGKGIVALNENDEVIGSFTWPFVNITCAFVEEGYRGKGLLGALFKEFHNHAIHGEVYVVTSPTKFVEDHALKSCPYTYREDNKLLYRRDK